MAKRASFDKVCKILISELGEHLQFISKSSYSIDSQTVVESEIEFKTSERSQLFTVDVAWLENLCRGLPKTWLLSKVISDVVVAWEIDATSSRKSIRASIDNLAALNPRLGIELLLIGGNQKAIKGYDSRFNTAIRSARLKRVRIIVITDVIFSQLYYSATGRHPQSFYDIYLDIASQDNTLRALLKTKWEKLLRETKTEEEFRHGINEKLVRRL